MHSSDWSSDVCSSDLRAGNLRQVRFSAGTAVRHHHRGRAQRPYVGVRKWPQGEPGIAAVKLDLDLDGGLGGHRSSPTPSDNPKSVTPARTAERRVGTECVRPCKYLS